ncbi:MAG: PAS domain S-box protein [Pseudomonadota bacterium]
MGREVTGLESDVTPVDDVPTRHSGERLVRPNNDAHAHVVQFYEDDSFLCDTVARFLGLGLVSGEPVVVIATQSHWNAFTARLTASAFDAERACASGQLTFLDAAETLGKFMRDGMPDRTLFESVVGGLLGAIRSRQQAPRVRAFGEMVDLLWREGNPEAALLLEEMWNDLGASHPLNLLCAYVMANFYRADDSGRFDAVCNSHSHVLPAESYTTLDDGDARLREISRLQQRAQSLEAELARRKEIEKHLRESQQELRSFLENAVEGLHWVGPDGIIQWANRAELELLGYSQDEYVGHHIAEFHADAEVIRDMLARLTRNEILQNQEARLKCKDGSIRHVLVNSSVAWKDGKFAHTCCFTRDVTERKQTEEERAKHFRTLIDSIPTLAWTARADGWIDFYNRRWYEYTGTTPEQMEGWGWQSVHDPGDLPKVLERWRSSIETGETFEMAFPLRRADGTYRCHLTRVEPLRDRAGRVVRWFGTNTDIDDQQRAETQLAAASRVNETLNRIGKSLNAELDLAKLVQTLTDEATALCRAEFGAYFYNVLDDAGESYMLYALAGVPREAFAQFPMPRNTAIFGPTFNGEAVVRLDDVTRDPRFGRSAPYYGMPEGHLPVRSYLAIPVISRNGEVLGGLFFGHSEVGVFTDHDEQLLVAIGAQAATAIDNARLYERERSARASAERAQQRTAKLHAITEALSRTVSADEAVRVVIRETLPIIGAAAGGVLLLDPSGTRIERLVIDGSVLGAAAEGRPLSVAENMPLVDAARTGKPVWLASEVEIAQRYPHLVALRDESGAKSWGAIPLSFEGRTIGSLGMRCTTERPLIFEDEQFLIAVAQQCAQAIQRARLYEQMCEARAAAEGASQAKDEFLAMLGHELRNPLAPIVTALQLMKLRGEARSIKEREIIERQVDHLVRLVDDLLDISKITRGKVRLDTRIVDLNGIVANAVETASPLFEHRAHNLDIALPAEEMWLDADETRLSQVIANLLTNAAKYTPPGGNISLRAWREGQEIVLQVKDDGVGIPAALLPRVFDLFVQGYRTSDRGQGGLGLGLALVRNLVSLHHGSVVALSEGEGKGSAFIVRLPGVVHDGLALETTQATAQVTRAVTPRRILVVDDNEDAALLLAEMLGRLGHEVVVAHDGPHALGLLERFSPEIAVLDIGLPVMDGYELASKLLERLASSPPRMIAVTGYGQDHDRARSRAAGFELHFVKPLDSQRLLEAIDGIP